MTRGNPVRIAVNWYDNVVHTMSVFCRLECWQHGTWSGYRWMVMDYYTSRMTSHRCNISCIWISHTIASNLSIAVISPNSICWSSWMYVRIRSTVTVHCSGYGHYRCDCSLGGSTHRWYHLYPASVWFPMNWTDSVSQAGWISSVSENPKIQHHVPNITETPEGGNNLHFVTICLANWTLK
mgnify:CR=1 FL=1